MVLILGSAGIVISSQDVRDDLTTRIAGLGPKAEALWDVARAQIAPLMGRLDFSPQATVPDQIPATMEESRAGSERTEETDKSRKPRLEDGGEDRSNEKGQESDEELSEVVLPEEEALLLMPEDHLAQTLPDDRSVPRLALAGEFGAEAATTSVKESSTPAHSVESEGKRTGGRFVLIKPGATISETVLETYGEYNALALDLVKEANPHIKNLDLVVAGDTLWLPPLTQETLIRRQSENSYRLVLAAFRRVAAAERLAQTARRQGYPVEIKKRVLSDSLSLYRVEIAGLPSEDAIRRAWDLVDLGNALSVHPFAAQGSVSQQNLDPHTRPGPPLETEL